MQRAAAVYAVALAAAAQVVCVRAQTARCAVPSDTSVCPTVGNECTQDTLCAIGSYCKADAVGLNSFSGVCAVGPDLEEKYGAECSLGNDLPDCVYFDHLRLSPRDPPSALRCVRDLDSVRGTCRIGPAKHGDACNVAGECASRHCQKELRMCHGIDEGEVCEPGYPDPCASGHYCKPEGTLDEGTCQKVVSAGKTCTYSAACERGTFCAGEDVMARQCKAPFSVRTGVNTTIGPYMCQSANAVLVLPRTPSVDSVYMCVDADSTRVGEVCDRTTLPPLGYECRCSSANSGEYRLRTVGALGLGGRSQAWRDIFQCLMPATGIMGDACEFDAQDMERVRPGSCAYYACYPYYLRLVNATGGRMFAPPLDQFETFSKCEMDAISDYYKQVETSPCVTLDTLENWKCASLDGPVSLSVASTSAVIAVVFLALLFGYVGHMWYFRKQNPHVKLPFVSDY